MPTINGTNSRRASNYDFYFDYSVTNDNANRRHILNVKAYIKCISWDFETAVAQSWVHINIGGGVYNRPAAGINCNQYAIPHTYLLWEVTVYLDYVTYPRSIYLAAYTDDLYVAGHGPGICNAATTITIPAKYSTAGDLASSAASECANNVVLSGIDTAVGYERTLKWYYKQSNATSWILFDTTIIAAASTTSSFTKQVGTLTPGTSYDFMVTMNDGTLLIFTKTSSVATNSMTGTFAVKQKTPTYILFGLTDLLSTPGYDRTVKLYYKKTSETEYVLAAQGTIANGIGFINIQTVVLLPGTDYDFKLNVYRGDVLIKTFAISETTLFTSNSIPDVTLLNAVATPFTNQVRVYWDCLNPVPGTSYKICYQVDGESQVEGSSITAPPTSGYTDITVGTITENVTMEITVKSYLSGASGNKETDPFSIDIIYSFEWDSEKVQGQPFELTANEWNRLVLCVNAKSASTISGINQGQPFDNEQFNTIQDELGITGNDKEDWEPITAAELNALRTAVNA